MKALWWRPKVVSRPFLHFAQHAAQRIGGLAAVRGAGIVLFLSLGGCQHDNPTTFSPEQVEIVAEGIPDAAHIELLFSVDSGPSWHCPGVNVSRRDEGRIDVWFLRTRVNAIDTTKCDVLAIENKAKGVLMVLIPHNCVKHKEVELFVDGSKSLGRWCWEPLGSEKAPVKTGGE